MASSKILTEWQTCYWNALASEVSIKVPVLTYIMPLQNTFSKLCSAAFLILFEFVGLLRCKIFFKVCLFGLNSYPLFLHTPAQKLIYQSLPPVYLPELWSRDANISQLKKRANFQSFSQIPSTSCQPAHTEVFLGCSMQFYLIACSVYFFSLEWVKWYLFSMWRFISFALLVYFVWSNFFSLQCILQLIALFFYNICEIISESAVPYGPP